ncbi:FHA domain-containing protein [Kitasatospora sp. NPDC059747]|uniref:FHA domain-containing protein n=1 Tax=Kitasatospora sp. NPDC059747 TaxID=3346930 RepID=UPI00364B7B07
MASDQPQFRRMERHLRGGAEDVDYLIDLSNVVRETALGGEAPRALGRLRLVLRALREFTGDDRVTVHAIADDSLMRPESDGHYPHPDEPRLLREWRDRGLIASVGAADLDLLEQADEYRIRVVSGDNFIGHRAEHRWIQGNRDRFLKPVRPHGGPVRLVPRDMRVYSDREISREGEKDRLRGDGMLFEGRPRRKVLERSWRCPLPGCHPAPAFRRRRVVCRTHGTLLTDSGPRRPRVQLKVMVDGQCRAWHNLVQDESVEFVLGRANLDRIEPCHLAEERRKPISREHLVLASRRGALQVLDTSLAGCAIRTARPGAPPTAWTDLPRLREESPQRPRQSLFRPFGPDDEILIAPGVVLCRSGQQWPGERPETVPAKAPRRSPTADEPTRPG